MSIVIEENWLSFTCADLADALQVLVGQDRLVHLEPLDLGGALEVEQVRPRPDERDEAHHQLLADRVDRRVRHLREVLLEVGVQQLRLVDDSTETGVSVPIEPTASWPRLRHRRHQELEALLRVAERLLQIEQRRRWSSCARLLLGQRQVADLDLRALQPLLVGVARRRARPSARRRRRCGPSRGRSAASCPAAGATSARCSPRRPAARRLPTT